MLREKRLEMYKKALEVITDLGNGVLYKYDGLCDLFYDISKDFKYEWSTEGMPSMFIITEIYDQRTTRCGSSMYWFYGWDERQAALRIAIYNIEREAPIN